MKIQLIQVPYDSGHEAVRTGAGPIHLFENGLEGLLKKGGHQVNLSRIKSNLSLPTENGTTFDVIRQLTHQVGSAIRRNHFPLILAGNCNSSVGALAGLGDSRTGVIWFDAHGDFNTPKTTTTGFLDGMGLAMASGRCWQALLDTIEGFQPVDDDCIVHVGARDLDPPEKAIFTEAGIPTITAEPGNETALLSPLEKSIQSMARRVDGICLHIDLDVLHTGSTKPNHLAVPGGLSPAIVEAAIKKIKKHVPLSAATIASYDPELDADGSVLSAAVRLIRAIVD